MEQQQIKSQRISRMDALLFAIALEVALLQMRIHEGSTRVTLFGTAMDKQDRMKYDKLVRDRDMVKDVLRRSLIEVAERDECNTLKQAVTVLEDRNSLVVAKRKEHDKLNASVEDSSNKLTTNRSQWTVKLRDAEYKIALLRDKTKDDLLNANMRLRYVELWLDARLEAQETRFQADRKTVKLPNINHEQRVHEEICKAIELQIQEREKSIEYWTERYAKDVVCMNKSLEEKRQQLALTTAKREELQKLFNLHEGEMRSWLSFKEQRAARLAREERVRNAATRIQAWWRGSMVRKALGPFKYLRNLKKSPSKSKKR